MTISDMMNEMASEAEAFAQANGGGHAVICSDLTHLWGALLHGPGQLRILIMYNGERNRETDFRGTAILGRVDRRFIWVVSRGRGLNVQRGDTLVTVTQSGDPLFDLVEKARDIFRGMQFDAATTERPVDFDSIVPFNTEGTGMIVDAYQIEGSVGVDIGTLVSTPSDFVS